MCGCIGPCLVHFIMHQSLDLKLHIMLMEDSLDTWKGFWNMDYILGNHLLLILLGLVMLIELQTQMIGDLH